MKFRNLAWLLPLFFCCCNKSQPIPTNQYEDFAFTTTYDSVIKCHANTTYAMTFSINVLSGKIANSPVSYTVGALPANITVIPDSQSVNQLLGGAFTFTIGNVPPGIDTVNFTITSAATGTQHHKLIIDILPPTNYAPNLVGTYTASYDFCLPDTFIHYSCVVDTVAGTPYEITISNIANLGPGFVVKAWVSNVITIPQQTVGGYTIQGSGIYFNDTLNKYEAIIQDTLSFGKNTEYCTIHLVH